MSRKAALALLTVALGIATPLAAASAQSTVATVRHDAGVAVVKLQGVWTQTKGEAKEQWGKLTDNDLQEIDGRREVLVGKLQTRYGISREEAERQVGNFEAKHP